MIACDLCGSTEPRQILHSRNLDGPLVQCSMCGLYYIGSRHSQLAFGIAPSSVVVERVRQANRGFQNLRLAEEHRLALLNARWRLNLIREHCDSGRLVEVGCARGDFLSVARDRFEVYGVEPNPELAEAARLIAPIHQDIVETLPSKDFDVAVSFHVIEHVDSPRRFIRAIAERVRPGGLVVIETPNIRSAPFRLLRSRWREFIPEHYYFFDPSTIRRLLESEGLKVERIFNIGKYASAELILNRLQRYTALMAPIEGVVRGLGLSQMTFRINPRDIMLVIASRNRAASCCPN